MPYSTERILVTHVGSLIRPLRLVEMMKPMMRIRAMPNMPVPVRWAFRTADAVKRVMGRPSFDPERYESCVRESVAEVVREQIEAGVDIVSDGEFGKVSFVGYIQDRLTGLQSRPLTPEEKRDPMLTPTGGRDREAFPEFYAEIEQRLLSRTALKRITCTGPVTYRGHAQVQRDINNLKAALKAGGATDAFLPAVSPSMALLGAKNEHYPDERSLLFAVAEALREEYRAIIDAGLMVQIDDPVLANMYEKAVPPMTEKEYREWAELRIEALNHALRGIPQERTRYHVCWGTWNAPHVHDVPFERIVDLVLRINVGAYSFEAANPRHEHEWRIWESVKLPPGKVLMPGFVTDRTNVVEHPTLVADRIVRFARLVGRENVIASTDCGFAQAAFKRPDPKIMWAKLKALAEGARLATRELWGR